MKTTVDVPEKLYNEIKTRAALKGQTVKAFFLDAVRDKLTAEAETPMAAGKAESGWRVAFGSADPIVVAEAQHVIDEEFERTDPEDWK